MRHCAHIAFFEVTRAPFWRDGLSLAIEHLRPAAERDWFVWWQVRALVRQTTGPQGDERVRRGGGFGFLPYTLCLIPYTLYPRGCVGGVDSAFYFLLYTLYPRDLIPYSLYPRGCVGVVDSALRISPLCVPLCRGLSTFYFIRPSGAPLVSLPLVPIRLSFSKPATPRKRHLTVL